MTGIEILIIILLALLLTWYFNKVGIGLQEKYE